MAYLTATVRLPDLHVGNTDIRLWALEPQYVNDGLMGVLQGSPLLDSVCIENIPKEFKKKYFRGCLDWKKDAHLLVARYGGIGDICWVLPAVRELKNRFPDIKVRFACFEKDREMIYNCDFIDEFIITHFPTVLDLKWADYVLDFFDTVEGIGEDEAALRNPIDINEEIIGYKIKDKKVWYKIEAFEAEKAKIVINKGNKKAVAISLVASSPHRSWYMQDKVIENLLADENLLFYVFAKDGFYQPVLSRIKELKSDRIKYMTGLTLREWIACMNECDVVMSNDSGAVHVCSGLSKKVVATYTTVPANTRINHYPTVHGFEAKCKCAPCYKLGAECSNGDKCLQTISVGAITNKIKELLGG